MLESDDIRRPAPGDVRALLVSSSPSIGSADGLPASGPGGPSGPGALVLLSPGPVGWRVQEAGLVAAGDGVRERPGSEEDARTVQQLAYSLWPDPQGSGDLDLRVALSQEAERGQLVFVNRSFT